MFICLDGCVLFCCISDKYICPFASMESNPIHFFFFICKKQASAEEKTELNAKNYLLLLLIMIHYFCIRGSIRSWYTVQAFRLRRM